MFKDLNLNLPKCIQKIKREEIFPNFFNEARTTFDTIPVERGRKISLLVGVANASSSGGFC